MQEGISKNRSVTYAEQERGNKLTSDYTNKSFLISSRALSSDVQDWLEKSKSGINLICFQSPLNLRVDPDKTWMTRVRPCIIAASCTYQSDAGLASLRDSTLQTPLQDPGDDKKVGDSAT